jgi:hypothetical protein
VQVHNVFKTNSKDGLTRIESYGNLISVINQSYFRLLAAECLAWLIEQYDCIPACVTNVEKNSVNRELGSHMVLEWR